MVWTWKWWYRNSHLSVAISASSQVYGKNIDSLAPSKPHQTRISGVSIFSKQLKGFWYSAMFRDHWLELWLLVFIFSVAYPPSSCLVPKIHSSMLASCVRYQGNTDWPLWSSPFLALCWVLRQRQHFESQGAFIKMSALRITSFLVCFYMCNTSPSFKTHPQFTHQPSMRLFLISHSLDSVLLFRIIILCLALKYLGMCPTFLTML